MFSKCLCFEVHMMRNGLDLGSKDDTPQKKDLKKAQGRSTYTQQKSKTRDQKSSRKEIEEIKKRDSQLAPL
jgi:hypothetical protein